MKRGGCCSCLRVAETVQRGVALSHKGRWPKRELVGANVNVLNPGYKADMGESTSVHGVEVSVSKSAMRKGPRVEAR